MKITFYQQAGDDDENERENETIRNRNVRASVLSVRASELFHSLDLLGEWVGKKLYTTACPHSYVYCPLNITCLFSVIQQ
jgi:hypothetical protein